MFLERRGATWKASASRNLTFVDADLDTVRQAVRDGKLIESPGMGLPPERKRVNRSPEPTRKPTRKRNRGR
jgi:hypothetical protein